MVGPIHRPALDKLGMISSIYANAPIVVTDYTFDLLTVQKTLRTSVPNRPRICIINLLYGHTKGKEWKSLFTANSAKENSYY